MPHSSSGPVRLQSLSESGLQSLNERPFLDEVRRSFHISVTVLLFEFRDRIKDDLLTVFSRGIRQNPFFAYRHVTRLAAAAGRRLAG